MITIKYYPKPSKDNQYVHNTISSIETAFATKVDIASSLKTVLKKPKLLFSQKKSDFLIINWLENHLRSSNNSLSILGIFKYFLYLLYFRLIAKKLIYVRHNIYPHNMVGIHAKIACYITEVGMKLCQQKVVHSGHLKDKGYAYVPHPLYDLKLDLKYKPKFNNYYIIFGRIERYKKIETIIKNWDLEETLLIAGSIGEQSYLDELETISAQKNIKFDARYIPDNEAASLVKESKGAILAHADEDMIVSGSFFFAITLGAPVFAIETPFFNWLRKEQQFKGLYLSPSPEMIITTLRTEHPCDSNAIKMQADAFFGPISTAKSWQGVIDNSSNPKTKDTQ